jgi:hypothetical protein
MINNKNKSNSNQLIKTTEGHQKTSMMIIETDKIMNLLLLMGIKVKLLIINLNLLEKKYNKKVKVRLIKV